MDETLPESDVVLLGVGHTNAHVLRQWRMSPPPGARLTCLSDFGVATYSGMLPGMLAGQYEPEEMQIDLVRLCAAAGARFIQSEVTGHDSQEQRLFLADRPPLRYDVLSIGIGSRPTAPPDGEGRGLAIKPMQTFLKRLDQRIDGLIAKVAGRPVSIAVAGGGVGGLEIVCCLPARLAKRYPGVSFRVALFDRNKQILSDSPAKTARAVMQSLDRWGVELRLGEEISAAPGDRDASGEHDLIVWATSARSPVLLSRLNLPVDDRGFLVTRETLQSSGSDSVFAVGDSGVVAGHHYPKAGVYAVRQGPVLWENIQRKLRDQPLKSWRPQASFLRLINTGDGRAVLSYKGWTQHARWCWRLKDQIDRRFMAKYQDYTPMAMSSPAPSSPGDVESMQCGGCGCKLPGDVLARVLSKLDNPDAQQVLVGLDERDDVAAVRVSADQTAVATIDFFSACIDDPFSLGRIAALNALSDLYASRARPLAALAMVTVPRGSAQQQEELLGQLLAGSLHELRPLGVPIVGGHTTEGPQLVIGYTLLGEATPTAMTCKDRLEPGDALVLTKPLGTGVLLAGHRRALCRHDWMQTLLESMLQSNEHAAEIAAEMDLQAVTDVTGFGLAGHLLEMLRASNCSAELSLSQLPLLPGAEELTHEGVQSSLYQANQASAGDVQALNGTADTLRYDLLFDPQTSGGLLMGAPPSQLDELLEKLGPPATLIGRVVSSHSGKHRIVLRADEV